MIVESSFELLIFGKGQDDRQLKHTWPEYTGDCWYDWLTDWFIQMQQTYIHIG